MTITHIPDYLYHYTSIENLALILRNRTIRFSPLDKLDDLQEKETKSLKNLGQYVFVSCWTSEEKESIPMWNMYGSLSSGVCIKLKTFPFERYMNKPDEIQKATPILITDDPSQPVNSFIPYKELIQKGYFVLAEKPFDVGVFHIEYTDDQDKLYPEVLSVENESRVLAVLELGKYKNTSWEFQKEWRYRIIILPINITRTAEETGKEISGFITTLLLDKKNQKSLTHYDLRLDKVAFQEMEIICSPRMQQGNKSIVRALVNTFAPGIIIKNSSLEGLI